jgi:nicotinamidase-related amidase
VVTNDLLVEKTAASALFPGRSALPSLLKQRGIDTVLIVGTVANVFCESTARDASTLGYRVIIVADANAAVRDQDLNATLHTIYRRFGDVRPTGEVLRLLGDQEP